MCSRIVAIDNKSNYKRDVRELCTPPALGSRKCTDDTGKTSILTRPEDPVYKPILEIVMFFCSSLYQLAVHGGSAGSSSQISSTRSTLKRGKHPGAKV